MFVIPNTVAESDRYATISNWKKNAFYVTSLTSCDSMIDTHHKKITMRILFLMF